MSSTESDPGGLPPFDPVAPATLRAHFGGGVRVEARPGETIIMAGDLDRDVYLVERGTIRFTLHSESGRETIFGEASEGTLFGELAAIDGRARSVIAVALDRTTLRRLRPARFMEIVTQDPELAH
ncbi:MAG: cyclic nucleotide-binding domain-containing protein, partial [Litorimonas sp.]